MKNQDFFIRYNELARKAQIVRGTKESLDWFAKVVRKEKQIRSIDSVIDGLKSKRISPGEMFVYNYDPKTKEKLPFYDTAPLVVILEVLSDGWYGINIHYLPPKVRATVMYEIGYNMRAPKQIASMLESNPLTKNCLKRYLASHLTSRPKHIPKDDWEIAIQLPFEGFEKASQKEVWKHSMRKK